MVRRELLIFVIGIAIGCQAIARAQVGQTNTKEQSQKKLAELIAKADGTYTRVADGVWQTAYKGKNMPVINIRIATAEGGVFFFADLFERKNLPLSRNLLLKIAELNADYDYAKLALSDDTLHVRIDARLRLMDVQEFKALENQTASVADEAYAALRDFLP